ncbi:MAG: FAD-dependent monooxygenase [Betaproteobacteria bacterium]
MAESTDIAIVGGGPVGMALALALADSAYRVTLFESRQRSAPVSDPRPLALSYGSRLLLERLAVWHALEACSTPIERIHVSQQGGFGRVEMTAAQAALPALGYVVDYARLHAALRQAGELRGRHEIRHAEVKAVHSGLDIATVVFDGPQPDPTIAAKLVVIADGGLRNAAATRVIDYGQAAVVVMVKPEIPHRNTAFERFTASGPLGLLPSGADIALVWSMDSAAARACTEEPEGAFLERLHQAFGRLGVFTVTGSRSCFPLSLRYAGSPGPRTIAIGNAAQTLHPVAGQGFNLGLRDAWELAERVQDAAPGLLGSAAMLSGYRRRRRLDRGGGIGFTDALVRIFSNDFPPLRLARGLGLAALDALPPAKDFVIRRMTFGARG